MAPLVILIWPFILAPLVISQSNSKPPTVPALSGNSPIHFSLVPDNGGITFRHVTGTSAEKPFPAANGSGIAALDYDLDGLYDLYFATGTPLAIDYSRTSPINSELETDLPLLQVAIGAAIGWLDPDAIKINLLVEELEASYVRRRDPVRWTIRAGSAAAAVLILWAGWLGFQTVIASTRLSRAQAEWRSLEKPHLEAVAMFKKVGEMERTLFPLQHHATNRFLWTLPLDALQLATSDDIQVVGLKMEQTLVNADAIKASKTARAQPAQTREQILLTISAKNFSDSHAEEKFIESIMSLPYFKSSLRKKEPVLLKNRMLRQVDPLDPSRLFTLFTIECAYPERVLGHE